MAKAKTAPTEEFDPKLLSEAPEDWQFETVAEESPTTVILEESGDVFIGQYIGTDHVEPENGDAFDRFVFRGRDGQPYAMNQSYKLVRAMDKVNAGDWVRVTLVKEIASNKGNPIKDYRVEVRTN